MRLLLLVAVCLGASAHSLPLNLTDLPASAILGGQAAKLGQFPFVVYIQPYCTGVIISELHVLTQESCVREIQANSKVYAGLMTLNNLDSPGVQQSAIRYTDFLSLPGQKSRDYAIGVITLETPFKYNANVKNILLLADDAWVTDPGNKRAPIQTISYGYDGEWRPNNHLSFMNLNIFASSLCSKYWSNFDGKWGICVGDGNHMYSYDDGAPLLTGNLLVGLAVFRSMDGGHIGDGGFYVRLAPYCFEIEKVVGHTLGCYRP